MRIVNIVRICKKKATFQYVNLIVKVFEENPERLFSGRGYEILIKYVQGSDQNWLAVSKQLIQIDSKAIVCKRFKKCIKLDLQVANVPIFAALFTRV